ncbi:hypothetical protein PVAND_016675 [Polypedilum vanderplanki]|uniref:Peptidase S1 domain-containing protein n=1 Tax=Polypedilum vanderplanki TaxID=319348 RepID=A0A9J6BFU2_POLVA|nr:hypothetical protein PVAND_016675 [Polypedilum vanderplanki]
MILKFFQCFVTGASNMSEKIVDGTKSSIEKYPYIVSLEKINNPYYRCAGSLISEKHVLTAAHCVYGVSKSKITVRVNSTFYGKGGKVISLKKIKIHPRYDLITDDYDIAVLELSENVNIRPIRLRRTKPPKSGSSAKVAGWGETSFQGRVSNELLDATVFIVDKRVCRKAYGYAITTRMLCANGDGKDSCQGDSGAPLIQNDVQIGVVSWGRDCGLSHYPGVYANVAAFSKFFDDLKIPK